MKELNKKNFVQSNSPSTFHFLFPNLPEFNATGSLTLQTRGCLDSDLCGKTLTGTILGAGYTSSFQCCTTELCNGASSVQISLTVALCAAVLSCFYCLLCFYY
uniref:Uncharacterized protein n=1 Tax=Lates calcarifer TaxID=8187 RepID=A0A4W6E6G8_LATCA